MKYRAIILFIFIFSNNSYAGAWVKNKGESEFIFKFEKNILSDFYENKISKIFISDFYSSFYEYGITDKVTFGIEEKWFNYKSYEENYTDNSESYNNFESNELYLDSHFKKFENKPYETKLYLKTPIWKNDNSIFSVKFGPEIYNNDIDKALNLSLLYGYSFLLGKEYSYINIEYEIKDNSNTISSKLETSLGISITSKLSFLLQYYGYKNIGINRNQDIDKGEISTIWKFNDKISWQTGYSTNITKRKEYIVEAYITGISIKF
ncbi:MAG: hypothetical protein AABY27_03325 [Pseudomonadota bacterium]|mgnify:CR=1 FL=1